MHGCGSLLVEKWPSVNIQRCWSRQGSGEHAGIQRDVQGGDAE